MGTSKLSRIQELATMTYTDANRAYEIVVEAKEDTNYQLSLDFMKLSYASYLELSRFYYDNQDIHDYEVNDFIKKYNEFIFELKQVIIEEDQNTSWLYSRHESLQKSWKELEGYLQRIEEGTY